MWAERGGSLSPHCHNIGLEPGEKHFPRPWTELIGFMLRYFAILSLVFCGVLYANMRQRWQVDRHPSYFPESVEGATVLSEDLVFQCDAPYEGDAEWEKMEESGCDVTARYRLQAAPAKAALEFILPSNAPVSARVNGRPSPTALRELTLSDLTPEAYRLSRICNFCGEATSRLYAAAFDAALTEGENTIEVTYRQPYSFYETRYGYFTTSEWVNAFSYELWPLKTWKRAADFQLKLRVNAVRPSFLRRMWKETEIRCKGEDLNWKSPPALPPESKTDLGFGAWLKMSHTGKDIPLAFETSGGVASGSTALSAAFPDRITCFLRVD